MKHIFLIVLVFLPNLTRAQTVQITEVAPHSLAGEGEWFEFLVDPADADMTTWQLSNGASTPKAFADHADKLHTGEDPGYFYFLPSPIGLTNSGGTLQILDEDQQILTHLNYPAAKSSSTKTYEQREVWNWHHELQKLLPQLVRAPSQSGFNHSRGQANPHLPTPADQFTAVINEASPDHDQVDFIEVFIFDGPEQINLQYTELKHNGTVLWRFENPFLVESGDFLLFKVGTEDRGLASQNPVVIHTNAREGLSGGSGTVELVGLSDTSLEARFDALCWQDETLSQTEASRVEKFVADEDWQGPCVEINSLIPNESVGRRVDQADSDTAADFFRHFNGSAGGKNTPQNHPPTAVIEVQGSGKTVGTTPFYLNVSGESSTDPDGKKDLKTYRWQLGNDEFSPEVNPGGFHLETAGEYPLRLTVTDHSGASHTAERLIVAAEPGRNPTTSGSTQAKVAAVQARLAESLALNSPSAKPVLDEFFQPFLSRTDWTKQLLNPAQTLRYPAYTPQLLPPEKPPLYDKNWPRRLNLPVMVRQRARKNLGVVFSWREAPWPDLAAEWTAVVAEHQRSAHFAAGYLGF